MVEAQYSTYSTLIGKPIHTDTNKDRLGSSGSVPYQLWDRVLNQMDCLTKKQKESESLVKNAIDRTFPNVCDTSSCRELQARCKTLFQLIREPFFQKSSDWDFISTLDITSFPSEEYLNKLTVGQKYLIENFSSTDAIKKYLKDTVKSAMESDDPIKYLTDRFNWKQIELNFKDIFPTWTSTAMDTTTSTTTTAATTGTNLFSSSSVNIDSNSSMTTFDMDTTTTTFDLPDQTSLECDYDGTNDFLDLDQDPTSTSLDTVGDALDTVTSGMGVTEAFSDFLDAGIPIPIFTMGVDVCKEIKLLAQGKTNVWTATGHVVGHALAVTTGSTMGAAVGTIIAPGLGTVIGGFIGVWMANRAYNQAKRKKLDECIERMNQYATYTNEQLNELINQVEKDTKQNVVQQNNVIKGDMSKRTPLPLNTVLSEDKFIQNLIPDSFKKEAASTDGILSLLSSEDFRREMNKERKTLPFLKRILLLLDEYHATWYLWLYSALIQMRLIQKAIGKEFQLKIQEINNTIEECNKEMRTLKKEAQGHADKLGIEVNFEGEKK